MIAVVQRVSKAQVAVAEPAFQSSIELGLVVLLCIQREDTQEDAAWMAGKIARLRVFPDEQQRFDRSVQDVQGDVLQGDQLTALVDGLEANGLLPREADGREAATGRGSRR